MLHPCLINQLHSVRMSDGAMLRVRISVKVVGADCLNSSTNVVDVPYSIAGDAETLWTSVWIHGAPEPSTRRQGLRL